MSSTPASTSGWLATNADRLAVDAAEADDDVGRPQLLHFEEVGLVDDGADDVAHVVGHLGIARDDLLDAALELGRLSSRVAGLRRCCAAGRRAALDLLEALLLAQEKKWALPVISAWTRAPPRSSMPIFSPSTVLMTLGPVMNILEMLSTTKTKSVSAGE
jgi:hypothetical protein